jgi:hypothetical protein
MEPISQRVNTLQLGASNSRVLNSVLLDIASPYTNCAIRTAGLHTVRTRRRQRGRVAIHDHVRDERRRVRQDDGPGPRHAVAQVRRRELRRRDCEQRYGCVCADAHCV